MELQLYRSLAKSRGWEVLANTLRERAEQSLTPVLTSVASQAQNGMDGFAAMMNTEFEKGLRAGLLLCVDMPRAMEDFLVSRRDELRAHVALSEEGFEGETIQ